MKSGNQEEVRLALALEGFFLEDTLQAQKEEFGQYLRRRIRPTMEALIDKDDVEKMEQLKDLGWLEGIPVEGFLKSARNKKKQAAMVWLLHLKDEKYGYADRDFTL